MAVIDSLGFAVDTSDLKRAQVELQRTGNSASKAATKSSKAMGKLRGTLGGVRSAVFSLQGAIGALGVSLAFREVLKANEAWTQQTNALKLVTSSSQQLIDVQNKLFDLAQKTRGATDGTVDLYARLARSTKNLGTSQEQLLTVTAAINKSIAISGGSAESANAAIFQLGQGLSAGALRGEELNSVMEQTPRLAQALAEGLGVGIGELRNLGQQGKLTSEVVIAALTNQADVLDKEFNQTAKTVSQSMTQLSNEVQRTLGQIDNQGLISAIDSIRETMSDPQVISGVQTLAQGMVTAAEAALKLSVWVTKIAKESGGGLGELIYGDIEKPALQAQAALRDQKKLVDDLQNSVSAYVENRNKLMEAGASDAQINALDQVISRQQAVLEREQKRLEVIKGINQESQKQGAGAAAGAGAVTAPEAPTAQGGPVDLNKQDPLDRLLREAELQEKLLEQQSEYNAAKLDQQRQYYADLYDISVESQQAMFDFTESVRTQDYKSALAHGALMLQGMSTQSKAMFKIQKAFALANALVTLPDAVLQSFRNGGGYPWGLIPAGLMLAQGLQQINAIRSASFSGGGTAARPSGGGGGGAAGGQRSGLAPVQQSSQAAANLQEPTQRTEVSIVVSGGLHSDDDVRKLIERVNQVNEDLGGNAKLVAS